MSTVNAVAASASAPQKDAYSALSSGDFMKIIFTELARQDPTQPSDSKALLEQLSTIRSIESNTELSDKLSSLVTQSEFAGASQLIGKAVSGVSETNQRKIGIVSGVSRTDKGSVVILDDGSRIDFKNVDEIHDMAGPSGEGARA